MKAFEYYGTGASGLLMPIKHFDVIGKNHFNLYVFISGKILPREIMILYLTKILRKSY